MPWFDLDELLRELRRRRVDPKGVDVYIPGSDPDDEDSEEEEEDDED